MTNIQDKIRQICTYHSDDGTSGYNLSEEQFQKIFDLFSSYQLAGWHRTGQELLKELKKLTTPGLKIPKMYSSDQVQELLSLYRQELVGDVKKALPTHKGNTLSRKEVKEVLDKFI